MISSKIVLKNKRTNFVTEFIKERIEDENTKEIILKATEAYSSIIAESSLKMNYISIIMVVTQIEKVKLLDLNWDKLCELYNQDYEELIKKYSYIFKGTRFEGEVNKIINEYVDGESTRGWIQYYKFVAYLFNYVIDNIDNSYLNGIQELKRYNQPIPIFNTITISSLITEKKAYHFMRCNILNNFPLNSSIDNIVTIEYTNLPDVNVVRKINYNIKTNSCLYHSIIKKYFEKYNKKGEPTKIIYKIFFYFWIDSLDGKILTSINDFDDNTFLSQYKFYEVLEKDPLIKERVGSKESLLFIIVNMYRAIIEFTYGDVNYKFSKELVLILNSKKYVKLLQEDYKIVAYSIGDEIPKEDKLIFVPNKYMMNNTNATNSIIRKFNCSCVSEEYRQDLKEFLWCAKGEIQERLRKIHYIIDMYNFREEYNVNRRLFKNSDNEDNKVFDSLLLHKYKSHINTKYDNDNTIASIYKIIRRYLNFHKEKYLVTEVDINLFNFHQLSQENNSNPITMNDIKLIHQELINIEKDHCNGRLYTIVFELFLQSNMRIGEIMNIKRNSIYSRNELTGTAYIKLLKKGSKGEFISKKLDRKQVQLLDEALEITKENYSGIGNDNYIFLSSYRSKNIIISNRIDFNAHFKKAIQNIKHKLDKSDYVAYNIRHTFIDNMYREGIKLNWPIATIEKLVGSTYRVANNHYRNNKNIQDYVEVLSKVTISSVSLNGEIISNIMGKRSDVRNGTGICKKNSCNYELAECLMCSNFATFISRIPRFEELIVVLNKDISNTSNQIRKEELVHIKSLAAKYLYELLIVKEKYKNGK